MKEWVFLLIVAVSSVSSYVVTWTGDDEVHPTSQHLLGQKMCTRGPAYWCHNITQAKECNAIHHCIDKVWKDMTLPEDNDSVCQVCKDMVQQARDQLLSNETQDELRQVLEGSCNLIPLKLIAKECRQLADEFIPELVDTLASRMDPQVVCAVSGLCNSARIDKMLEDVNSPKKFDLSVDSCPKCNYYMGKAVDYLKGLPENDLLEKALMICGRFGSFSDSCSGIVFAQMDAIYSHLQSQVNSEEFCGLVGLCEVTGIRRVQIGHSSTAVRVYAPEGDDLPCDFCKQLVVHMKQWLLANTTKDEFRDLVKGICKQTGKFRKECLSLAQQYGKPLYQLLIDESNPDVVCGQIGVCPNSGKFQLFGKPLDGPIMTILPVPEKHVDLAPRLDLAPAEMMTGDEESRINQDRAPMLALTPPEEITGEEESRINQDITPMLALNPAERITGDDELHHKLNNKEACEICELFLHELQNYLEQNSTEEEIAKEVEQVCNRFPEEIKNQCHDFLESYADSVVVMIAQRLDPSVICPKLRLCPGSGLLQHAPVQRVPLVRVDRRPVGDLPTCPMCHIAVRKIIDMIGNNRTTEAIDRAVDSVCYIPGIYDHLREKCLNFMIHYGNQVAEMLVMEGTAREICMALHLCVLSPAPTTTAPPKIIVQSALPFDRFMPPTILRGELQRLNQEHPELTLPEEETNEVDAQQKPRSGQTCIMCEFVMDKLKSQLKDNTTEEEIKDEVEAICTYLPKSIKETCKNFIDTYGDAIIQYLVNAETPEEICQELGLCKSSLKQKMEVELRKLEAIKDVSMGQCQLCTVISDYLSAMLEDPKVETSVDKIVEKICPVMPSKYRNNCKEMIEDYGPYLMSLLAQETDKGKACIIMSFCSKSSNPLLV